MNRCIVCGFIVLMTTDMAITVYDVSCGIMWNYRVGGRHCCEL